MSRTALAAVAVLMALSFDSCDTGNRTAPTAQRSGDLAITPTPSCARSYDEAGLRAQSFALDGTVESVRRHGRLVELHVNEWFLGGSGVTLSLTGLGDPGSSETGQTSEAGMAYDVGTRLLVSGQYAEDGTLLVRHCGYTRYWTRDDDATWRRVYGSATPPVPSGQTTVPYVPFGASDDEIVRLLDAAGLVAVIPDVDFPHYVTGVDPPAGTVVPLGTGIDVEIGDG